MAADRLHPGDDQLIGLYFGDGSDRTKEDRAVRQHVHGCEACTWRYTELTAPLARLRSDAASEADEVFTPARLGAQRAAIMARLEQGAREPRVIPFPVAHRRLDRPVTARPAARWIAAAAVAGLVLGVTATRVVWIDHPADDPVARASAPAARVPAAPDGMAEVRLTTTHAEDEAFLYEVELAVSRQQIPALSAIDDLTPRLAEVAMARR